MVFERNSTASGFNCIDLTLTSSGPRPSPRKNHGFAVANNKLYVHGGRGEGGILFCLNVIIERKENEFWLHLRVADVMMN
jgi:hypothetical protein